MACYDSKLRTVARSSAQLPTPTQLPSTTSTIRTVHVHPEDQSAMPNCSTSPTNASGSCAVFHSNAAETGDPSLALVLTRSKRYHKVRFKSMGPTLGQQNLDSIADSVDKIAAAAQFLRDYIAFLDYENLDQGLHDEDSLQGPRRELAHRHSRHNMGTLDYGPLSFRISDTRRRVPWTDVTNLIEHCATGLSHLLVSS